MKKETIMLLKELIKEKDDRLEAINRRLDALRSLVLNAETMETLHLLGDEIKSLGEEINFLTDSRRAMQNEINGFYRPAA